MIACPQLRACFVAIEKTGSSTVTMVLAPYTEAKHPRFEGLGWQSTLHLPNSHQHSALEPGYEDWFSFGFCRNPYTRFVSWKDKVAQVVPPQWPRLKDVDHIARFEDFEEELARVCGGLGIPVPDPLPHRLNNVEKRRPPTEKEAAFVWERYRDDFENLGYQEDSWKDL